MKIAAVHVLAILLFGGTPPPPVNVSPPGITTDFGTVSVTTPAVWAPATVTLAYQWFGGLSPGAHDIELTGETDSEVNQFVYPGYYITLRQQATLNGHPSAYTYVFSNTLAP